MARTTQEAVDQIIDYDRTLIPDTTPFIESANLLVTDVVAVDPVPSDALLELVERYVAAHLIAMTDPRIASEQVKTLLSSYQHKLTEGLGLSHYGATAMVLDTTGRLARWNKKQAEGKGAVQFFWAGVEN